MMASIEYSAIVSAIQQSTLSHCLRTKQRILKQIQEWDGQVGFIPALIQFLEASQPSQAEERQFASILLKNSVLKIIQQPEELRRRHEEEIQMVKRFLLRSFGETQHQVFFQLHSLTSKLARTYWPQQWPELIPALLSVIANGQQFLHSFEATCCLHEVMVELSNKASCCGGFYSVYYELCLQLFQPIAKYWAIRMKSIQAYLVSYANRISEEVEDGSFYFSNQCLERPRYERDETQETSLFYAIVMAKVLKMIIETAFVDIVKRFPCFSCLWKTYMGSIQIGTSFIRRIRPHFSRLTSHLRSEKQKQAQLSSPLSDNHSNNHSNHINNSNNNSNSQQLSIGVLERFHALDIDDFNFSGDFYFNLRDYSSSSESLSEANRGFITITNLIMKFIKVLNCLPVHLQKKYPLEVIPLLEPLVQFYYKFQVEEVSTDLISNMVLTILPLTSVTFASQLVLANVLTCEAYKDYNRYRLVSPSHSYLPPNSSNTSNSNSNSIRSEEVMDEAVIEASIATANDFLLDFFNEIRVKELLERQLVFGFHYTPPALEMWTSDPERFFIDEEYGEGMAVEYLYVRHSTERLFVSLLERQPRVVVEIVLNLLRDVRRQDHITGCDQEGNEAKNCEILLWDAIYTAAGLGVEAIAASLGVTPTAWLLEILGPLFNNLLKSEKCGALHPSGQQVLRARILQLISSWISQFDPSIHSTILSFLVNLLSFSSHSDVVVLLSTVKCLAALIHLKSFHHPSLVPVALPCIQSLLVFYQRSLEESETKLMVLSLVKDIIQLVGVQITDPSHELPTDLVLQLGSSLVSLWTSTASSDILRGSILEVLVTFVQAMKETFSLASDNRGVPLVEVFLSIALSASHNNSTTNLRNSNHSNTNSTTTSNHSNANSLESISVLLESLLLIVCITRNINPAVVISRFPQLIHKFIEVLRFISSSIFTVDSSSSDGSSSMLSKFESEANLKVLLERLCAFLTSFMVLYSSQLAGYPEIVPLVQQIYSQLVSHFPPQVMRPVLQSMESLLLVSSPSPSSPEPHLIAEMLFQARAVTVAINICCSHASCPNLSGLMKSYQVHTETLLLATNILNLLILSAPGVFMKAIQVVKQEILSFLLTVTGVSQTNLSETLLLNEVLCVIIKSAQHLQSYSDSTISAIYRLRLYCLALWSFISPSNPNHPNNPNNPSNASHPSQPVILWQYFPLESIKPWLKDCFQLINTYHRLCTEFFSSYSSNPNPNQTNQTVMDDETVASQWKEECYNSYFSSLFAGPFPAIQLSEKDIERLFTSPVSEEISLNRESPFLQKKCQKSRLLSREESLLPGLLQNLQLIEEKFDQFHQQLYYQLNHSRIQHIDHEEGIVERDDVIVSQFLTRQLQHSLYQTSLPAFVQERCRTVESSFGREYCLHIISSCL